jgi:hypothetical protein
LLGGFLNVESLFERMGGGLSTIVSALVLAGAATLVIQAEHYNSLPAAEPIDYSAAANWACSVNRIMEDGRYIRDEKFEEYREEHCLTFN